MPGFYEGLRDNTAGPLIKKFGQPMSLVRETLSSTDEVSGSVVPGIPVVFPCFGLVQNIDSKAANQFYGSSSLQGTLIQKDDEMVLLSAQGLKTKPSSETDKLVVGNNIYKIVSVVPLEPGGVAVTYTLQVRR